MAHLQQTLGWLVAGALVVVAGCNRGPEVLTPEAASARGDALLREMSTNLGAAQTFALTVDERRERVDERGAKTERRVTRHVTIRRPNAFAFTSKGDAGEYDGWYNGKDLTLVAHREKVWARGPMPATLDEALDFLSAEYGVQMAAADLLYSSPYDAFMGKDTTGGWVDVQKIGNLSCDHLAYKAEVVDWEIWLGPERRLPCQLKIIYKRDPGQPTTTITYRDPESPQVTDETFAAKVPDGFNRIKIMRHATVNDPNVGGAAPASDPAKKPE